MSSVATKASKALSAKRTGRKAVASKVPGRVAVKGGRGRHLVQRASELKLDMSPEDAEFHDKIAEAAAKDLLE